MNQNKVDANAKPVSPIIVFFRRINTISDVLTFLILLAAFFGAMAAFLKALEAMSLPNSELMNTTGNNLLLGIFLLLFVLVTWIVLGYWRQK